MVARNQLNSSDAHWNFINLVSEKSGVKVASDKPKTPLYHAFHTKFTQMWNDIKGQHSGKFGLEIDRLHATLKSKVPGMEMKEKGITLDFIEGILILFFKNETCIERPASHLLTQLLKFEMCLFELNPLHESE